MKATQGIKLLEDREGEGRCARSGDPVVFNWRVYLNKGQEVPVNDRRAEEVPAQRSRTVGTQHFLDHLVVLGTRQVIAGVEYTLLGMKPGGYRKVRISPHLAYREQGIPGLIPAKAVLIVEIWLREIGPCPEG